jgi:hypothetical protein
MRKAPLGQCFDFLKAEGHLDHGLPPAVYPKLIHQRPYGQSCQSSICERARYIALSVAFLTGFNSFGEDAPKAYTFSQSLAAAPTAELPAKAADLVAQATSRDRHATTIDVVKGALAINPAAAPYIVSTIARAVPDMAPVAVGAAAAEQPRQARAIAKAAAAAAPSKAGKIVVAVCRAVPSDYRNIVVAVFEAVPGSGNEIVRAVAAALPELRPGIEQTLAGCGRYVASMSATLDQAATVSPAATAATPPPWAGTLPPLMVRDPVVAPSYWPLTKTPTNVMPGTSGPAPPGGRNYATP